tara:strand:- start:1307 stop:1930 length:624 start_codon:yes stop_codon:yes gene_type:complete
MNIEKHLFSGRRALFVGGLALMLSSCTSWTELPRKAAEEVINLGYKIATLPFSYFQEGERVLFSVNGCINLSEEKVCKLYLEEEVHGANEEYFGVLRIRKPNNFEMTLGYSNDGSDIDGNRILTVIRYKGKSFDEFVIPEFGENDHSYEEFRKFFDDPTENQLDVSDNQVKKAIEKGLIGDVQMVFFLDELRERVGHALELLSKEKS